MAWRKKTKPKSAARRTAALESIFGFLGAVLAAATVGTILWKGVTDTAGKPAVEARVLGVEAQGNLFLAEIELFNRGDAAAAGIEVEGRLKRGGQTVETATATFDYLPSQSRRQGGLYFSEDPGSGTLNVAPKSYTTP